MPWKTTNINLSEEFDLDEPGLFVKIIPLSWLPEETMFRIQDRVMAILRYQEAMDEVTSDIELTGNTEEDEAIISTRIAKTREILHNISPIVHEVMIECVHAWNIKDDRGAELPIPRVLQQQNSLGLIDKLIPLPVRMRIVMASQDVSSAELPLVNDKQSNVSSTEVIQPSFAGARLQDSNV